MRYKVKQCPKCGRQTEWHRGEGNVKCVICGVEMAFTGKSISREAALWAALRVSQIIFPKALHKGSTQYGNITLKPTYNEIHLSPKLEKPIIIKASYSDTEGFVVSHSIGQIDDTTITVTATITP